MPVRGLLSRIIFISMMFGFGASPSAGQMISKDLRPEEFGPVSVETVDKAVGGCWTNAPAIRKLMDELLPNAGYSVDGSAEGRLIIAVTAARGGEGACTGSISIQMSNPNIQSGATLASLNKDIPPTSSANPTIEYHVMKFVEALGLAADGWEFPGE